MTTMARVCGALLSRLSGPQLRPVGCHLLHTGPSAPRPIRKLLAANRSEIAIRILRGATELDIRTVAIFSKQDLRSVHRYKADEAYEVGAGKSPVAAYLDIPDIIRVAKEHGVDAIHPGYGFLSENVGFARACEENDIIFVGPTSQQLANFGDKTKARELAIAAGLPVVPGTDGAVETLAEAQAFVDGSSGCGYPVIIKAAHGGGGKGMRIVKEPSEMAEAFNLATSEAKAAFGNGTVFIERFITRPRHIEVQVLSDGSDVVHLYERDCSVQRRHQKVVEVAPAVGLEPALRARLCQDAVNICRHAGYRNAGTVEFLLDTADDSYYFIEVNPRIQVEHTVTEQVTGVDLIQNQILVAGGHSLQELGLEQDNISVRGNAIQCRITTEDPLEDFRPDSGRLDVVRPADGMGIRLDGAAYAGSIISPFYDSMLIKITGNALTFQEAAKKVERALTEFRIRGTKTNIPFCLNVLRHEEFLTGTATTRFIEEHPELYEFAPNQNRANKVLAYLGDVIVNGRSAVGATGPDPPDVEPVMPLSMPTQPSEEGFRKIYVDHGPAAFAKAIREHKGVLFMDTTWRDAHQSLLATRVRTYDLLQIAPATSHALKNCYSLENWGGATFDVAMRFLHECPWDRLAEMREAVPNIPFQMLLRGANAVGYTSYPDNAIYKFCDVAKRHGMDVFRVFDSLNYMDNLRLGIDAAGAAGGIVEGTLCYTGDLTDPARTKYNLEYYLTLAEQLVDAGCHVLCVKDMAGLLKPAAATQLISALRQQHPTVPIHVHTHDTGGLGVMAMSAALDAGADVVDGAVDSMSGMTSQPSLGGLVELYHGSDRDSGIVPGELGALNEYWESVRKIYGPFESGQLTGNADVFSHEIPGGQYTNLFFQANSLGLGTQWRDIKKAYAAANRLLGDIVKVTPSSKVVGDLAQFMVQNKLTEEEVVRNAENLSFPSSVVEYFQGLIGHPQGGFPEPLRTRVLKGAPAVDGRPGASMPDLDFVGLEASLRERHPSLGAQVKETDLMSAAMYPKEFNDFQEYRDTYGDLAKLPTLQFIKAMRKGQEFVLEIVEGKTLIVKFLAKGTLQPDGTREVFFEVNGVQRSLMIHDKTSDEGSTAKKIKANTSNASHLGAPMPGAVVDVQVASGDVVKANQPCVILNAMKMETVVKAPKDGVITAVHVSVGDTIDAGDLLIEVSFE